MSKYKVDNEELRQELINYIDRCEFKDVQDKHGNWKRKIHKRGKVSDKLGRMIMTIAQGLSTRGNWRGYTWKEDFVSKAILTVLKYMHNFDYNRYTNAHGYINMICSHAFLQYINEEKKKHSKVKKHLYDRQNELLTKTSDHDIAIDYTDMCEKDWFLDDIKNAEWLSD